jgi:hypothetical protein
MLKLFLLASILTFIMSQQVPSFNFSSIPSNTTVTNNACGVPNPTKKEDCFKSSDIFSYCCYLTPPTGAGGICQPINPTKYQTSMKTWMVNGTSYGIDCGITEGAMGTPCGVVEPKVYTDCTKYSTTNNSCCYYTNSTISVNYCFWMGSYLPLSPIPAVQCTPPVTAAISAEFLNLNKKYLVAFVIVLIGILY